MAEKLLLTVGIGRSLYGKWRIQKLISILIRVAAFGLVATVTLCATLFYGLYLLHEWMLAEGMGLTDTLLATFGLLLALVVMLAAAIRSYLHEFQKTVSTPLERTVDAFLDGLLKD